MALIEFKDLPDTTTPITASNLNNNFEYLEEEMKEVYSTSEQVVGTFLDKPLYKKTITFTDTLVAATTTSINHNISNADYIWIDNSHSFIINASTGVSTPLPSINYGSGFNDRIGVNANRTSVDFTTDTGWGSGWQKVITLLYTKTTD